MLVTTSNKCVNDVRSAISYVVGHKSILTHSMEIILLVATVHDVYLYKRTVI